MIAIDTNLLVYAHREGLPEHRKAKQVIEKASIDARGWAIPFPCVAEFWSVVTHPLSKGGASRLHQARGFLAALEDAGAKVLYPRTGLLERLATLALARKVDGVRIFDMQIAMVSKEAGAVEIWTHDLHFTTVPGLTVVRPF